MLVVLLLWAATARGETIVVNLSSDEPDADPNDGIPDVDLSTPGLQVTLRAAIEHANANPGADTITFDPAIGIISPATLPEVTEPIAIDGAVAGGRVQLDRAGLVLRVGDCSIANLRITAAPGDALTADSGALTVANVELTGAAGLGVRARGQVNVDRSVIGGNTLGGVLSSESSVSATSSRLESNGGPGVIAKEGIELVAALGETSRVQVNGGGLFTDGWVVLRGPGLHQINGNFGDGIDAGAAVGVENAVEIFDNAGSGVYAGSNVQLGRTATVSGNGHGLTKVVPEAVDFDLRLVTITGDAVRGVGVYAPVSIAGADLVASDNGGPALVSDGGITFERVRIERNDGHGIQARGTVDLVRARVTGNLGAGVVTTTELLMHSGTVIEDNASAAILAEHAFVGGEGARSSIRSNGKGARATLALLGDGLELELAPTPVVGAGVIATGFFLGLNLDVVGNGGDGVRTDNFELVDSTVTDNDGIGVSAEGGGLMIRSILCDNRRGDLVAFDDVTTEDSMACDREVAPPEGCACNGSGRPPASSGLLIFLLAALLASRRSTTTDPRSAVAASPRPPAACS